MKRLIYLFVIFILSCNSSSTPPVQAFYFWRNHLNITDTEKAYLEKSTSEFLYTRFFDVDKVGNKFTPIGLNDSPANFNINKKVVPVVYIVNRVWNDISASEIDFLVDKIVSSIQTKAELHDLQIANEIQIDSDWTIATQQDYFSFLEKLKSKTEGIVSCTIRLHQIKDREQTGIPPVDKGYLMCYATSSPLDNTRINSILDVDLLKSYLANLSSYPLSLDMAFPIYSWGIVSNHVGKKQLLNAVTAEQLKSSPGFSQIDEATFKIEKEGFYFGLYMNKGFTVKVEEISESTLRESMDYIDEKWKHPYELIWYHLDERFITNYPNTIL